MCDSWLTTTIAHWQTWYLFAQISTQLLVHHLTPTAYEGFGFHEVWHYCWLMQPWHFILKNIIIISQLLFVKFSLGVYKFESNTLTLGELGRFPIERKAIRQSILYWLRLEQGTENPLLNLAFHDCKFFKMNWLIVCLRVNQELCYGYILSRAICRGAPQIRWREDCTMEMANNGWGSLHVEHVLGVFDP